MKKFINLLFLGLLLTNNITAQISTGVCGMSTADQMQMEDRLLQNIQYAAEHAVQDRSGAIQYVPIFFHIVGDSNGAGKHKEYRILEQLCDLNESYLSQNIQFYLLPHPTYGLFDYTINNDGVYTTQTNTFLMANKKYNSALNVYVTNIADSGNSNPIGITLAYYSPQRDWVVSRKDQINGGGNGTLAHEIGHFFSLRHTFYGWESEPFQASSAGWPKAPSISPGGVPTEKMSGSNGSTAADLIIDTKPDYNFGILAGGCDPYTGGAKDPDNVLVDPQENNFMGYFSNCNYVFTPGQAVVIGADLNSPQRNFLDNTYVPQALTVTTPADILTAPTNNDTVDFYDQVNLQWKNTPGANYYLLEVDLTAGFSTNDYQAIITTSTSQLLTNLKKSRTYYWRIRPFNQYATCAVPKAGVFKTPASSVTGIKEIEGLEDWSIQPNPANDAATISVTSDRNLDCNVVVVDATGKQVYAQTGYTFPAGTSNYVLPIHNLNNGVYFVSIIAGDASMNKKLVVLH